MLAQSLLGFALALNLGLPIVHGSPLVCPGLAVSANSKWNDLSLELPSKISLAALQDEDPNLFIYPDVRDADEVDTFLDANPFMGFVSIGERVLLVTRNARVSTNIFRELGTDENLMGEKVPVAKEILELPGYVAFDISAGKYFEHPVVRKILNLRAWDEGPNCWNLCQIYHGWARTAYSVGESEFNIWMESPFTRPAERAGLFGMKPNLGDVIILRNRNFKTGNLVEMHGMVSLGNNLVITKNGTDYDARYRLMNLGDALNFYLPAWTNSFEVRVVRRFEDVWTEWKPKLSPELSGFVEEWMKFEEEHAKLYPLKKGGPETEDERDHKALNQVRWSLEKKIQAVVDARLATLEKGELSETAKVERFFWRLLKARTTSVYF
ncbi:MAG: hypothetical protein K2X47_16335 [Bdellovibrionales bacterium]|nr:hypothetical protein [Bdellovibrionales bacterium]